MVRPRKVHLREYPHRLCLITQTDILEADIDPLMGKLVADVVLHRIVRHRKEFAVREEHCRSFDGVFVLHQITPLCCRDGGENSTAPSHEMWIAPASNTGSPVGR